MVVSYDRSTPRYAPKCYKTIILIIILIILTPKRYPYFRRNTSLRPVGDCVCQVISIRNGEALAAIPRHEARFQDRILHMQRGVGPLNKDLRIWGSKFGSPYFEMGKLPFESFWGPRHEARFQAKRSWGACRDAFGRVSNIPEVSCYKRGQRLLTHLGVSKNQG